MIFVNIAISASVISFCALLANRKPELAGFILSLPLSTLLALALNQAQYNDPAKGTLLAKSIFVAVPSSLLFFIPFLFAERLKLSFWMSYVTGVALLVVAYFIHQFVMSLIER